MKGNQRMLIDVKLDIDWWLTVSCYEQWQRLVGYQDCRNLSTLTGAYPGYWPVTMCTLWLKWFGKIKLQLSTVLIRLFTFNWLIDKIHKSVN